VREQEPEHELQTTPEFRSFVAKKLAAIIDRFEFLSKSLIDGKIYV